MLKKDIIKKLKKASTEKEIDSIFSKRKGFDSISRRLLYLKSCYNEISHYTGNYESLSDEQKYEYEMAIFLKRKDLKKTK